MVASGKPDLFPRLLLGKTRGLFWIHIGGTWAEYVVTSAMHLMRAP